MAYHSKPVILCVSQYLEQRLGAFSTSFETIQNYLTASLSAYCQQAAHGRYFASVTACDDAQTRS